ncbi:bacteriophage tail protein [Salmonella enterica subsp. enterica]|nr:bacteriophage tail protein [Salmonella enterica subsp. enterica]
MELKNVNRYIPDDPDYDSNFLYFRSEDGQDFYESLSKFTKKYKLCIDSENIIRSVSEDVSRLYPAGFSVVEVNKLPAGFNIYGDWKYSNGAVVAVPVDYQAKAEKPDRNYWMPQTAPLLTGEPNWRWVKSVMTIRPA